MRARNLLIGLLFLMGVGLAASASPAGAVGLPDLGAFIGPLTQQSPSVPDAPKVDVNIHKSERVVWFTNPMVIGGAVVVLIVVVALIARGGGGGTTVVKG
jgi:hypothetical protein